MSPLDHEERITALEKERADQKALLSQILKLAEATDTAIRGDPARGLTGIVDRQIVHGQRLDVLEERTTSLDQRKWYAQGAVWATGVICTAGATVLGLILK